MAERKPLSNRLYSQPIVQHPSKPMANPTSTTIGVRDVLREVPGATKTVLGKVGKFGVEVARAFPRAIGTTVATFAEPFEKQKEYSTDYPIIRTIFGEEPIRTVTYRGEKGLESIGTSKGAASVAAPFAGLAVTALDAIPLFGGSGVKAAEKIAASSSRKEIIALLEKIGVKTRTPEFLDDLVKAGTPEDVGKILKRNILIKNIEETTKIRPSAPMRGAIDDVIESTARQDVDTQAATLSKMFDDIVGSAPTEGRTQFVKESVESATGRSIPDDMLRAIDERIVAISNEVPPVNQSEEMRKLVNEIIASAPKAEEDIVRSTRLISDMRKSSAERTAVRAGTLSKEKGKAPFEKSPTPPPIKDPLIQEARKYKSAEEFVKAQAIKNSSQYGDRAFTEYLGKTYDEFATKKQSILKSAKNIDPKIEDVRLGGSYGNGTPTPNSDIDLEFTYKGTPPENLYEKLAGQFQLGDGMADAGVVPNTSKSQLTDIWKKARASEKKTTPAPKKETAIPRETTIQKPTPSVEKRAVPDALGKTDAPKVLSKEDADAIIESAKTAYFSKGVPKYVDKSKTLPEKLAKEPSAFTRIFGELGTPISTRLENINPKLKIALRKFEYEAGQTKIKIHEKLIPFFKGIAKMDEQDAILFDIARKNGDSELVNALSKKYGMEEETKKIRGILDKIYQESKEVGLDVNYRENYFPRKVKDPQKFLEFLRGKLPKGDIEKLLKKAADQRGKSVAELSEEERASIVNGYIRGYGDKMVLYTIGNLKQRSIPIVTKEINAFYENSDVALVEYIHKMSDSIQARKFFGRSETGDIEDSIGMYVQKLVSEGSIKPSQEREVANIFRARFNNAEMNPFLSGYRTFSYIDTLGNPIPAITQLQDLAFAFYKNGLFRTLSSALGKKTITKEDLGIEKIAEEYLNEIPTETVRGMIRNKQFGRLLNAMLSKTFKVTGFERMDKFGKEALINSSLKKYHSLAKKSDNSFKELLQRTFGKEEATLALEDFKNKVVTDRVKLMVFNDLTDFQPITRSEMPEVYLKNPNSRVFYMLKSYQMKLWDVYRREVFREAKKNPVKAMRNLVALTLSLTALGIGADEIKDLILGRKTTFRDRVTDNLFKLTGFGKFYIYKAKEEGLGKSILSYVLPPFKAIDNLSKDIYRTATGEEYERGATKGEKYKLEITSSIPVIGNMYYWWFGRGEQKERYKQGLSTSSSSQSSSVSPKGTPILGGKSTKTKKTKPLNSKKKKPL